MIYSANQNGLSIRLLQTGDRKRYNLSDIRSDEGEIVALINFPFFANYGVVGRYQGDVFNDTVDQDNFKGLNLVIFKDNTYKIGYMNSWDYQDISKIAGGCCPSAVLLKGKELEISDTIIEQGQWTPNNVINRVAITYDGEYHFDKGDGYTVDGFLKELKAKYPNYEFIALGDAGGSAEEIIEGVIQGSLSEGKERPNYCAWAFIKTSSPTPEPTNKNLFIPRLSKEGMLDNKYWYDKTYNAGVSDGKYDDSALANCVCYASGRFGELNNQNMRNIMKNRTGFGNACEWYRDTKYDKGSKPVCGAIACFGGTYGHVAIVERVNEDGTVLVSQSNYEKVKQQYNSDNYFQTRTYKLEVGKVASGVGLVFQGYIYPPNVKYGVDRDTKKDQVQIIAEKLKVRKNANGDWLEGRFAPIGLYDILEFKNEGDYTWAKIFDDMWIALNDSEGWTKTYRKDTEDDKDKVIAQLRKEIEELKIKNNELLTKVANLESDLSNKTKELEVEKNKLTRIGVIVNE